METIILYTVMIKWTNDSGANDNSEINNILKVEPGALGGWSLTSFDGCVRWINKDLVRMLTIIPPRQETKTPG